jgi:zinc transport system ATP-binding protein
MAPRGAVADALQATGVADLAKRRIGEMSGGQRQRVLLAKALVSKPQLLILDEPTTGVDPAARDSFAHLLTELSHERGVTVLLVSHDADMLHHVATRLLVIDRGLVSDAPPDRVSSTLESLHHHERR